VLAPELLEILVCPKSKSPLIYFPRGDANDDEAHGFLLCAQSRLRYRIDEGVPVLLVDEATALSQPEVDALIARAGTLGLSH
jgi:hypothetical protein